MEKIIASLFLILTSCATIPKHRFELGDCIIYYKRTPHPLMHFPEEVIDINKEGYVTRIVPMWHFTRPRLNNIPFNNEEDYLKVGCPVLMKEYD